MSTRAWFGAVGIVALLVAVAPAWAEDAGSFAACVDALRRERGQHPEIRAATFERYTRDAADLRETIRTATETQPEFGLPVWDYIARLVDAQRVADGRDMLAAQAAALQAIGRRHGVDAATVVAVFGVETDYGRHEGRYPVVDATLSRACLNLSSTERKRHFFAALWLLQEGLVKPEAFRGSWAGAFGQTQFMPDTYIATMEAADGSGVVDIIGSAADALATTARYLASLGWVAGLRWGVEVAPLPADLHELIAVEREHGCLGSDGPALKCRSIEQWAALGVTPIPGRDGGPRNGPAFGWPRGTRAALIAPAGGAGPAWLVTRNFQALWQYNRADAYALAIGLLSDALRGEAPMRTPWPTDDPGLSRSQLRELQTQLIRHGHPRVVADGYDGPLTRDAIRDEEQRMGWPQTGRAGVRMWRAMNAQAPEEPAGGVPAPTPDPQASSGPSP